MKFILSIAFAILLFSNCSKSKNNKKYVLKGRMMNSCEVPAANTTLNLYEGKVLDVVGIPGPFETGIVDTIYDFTSLTVGSLNEPLREK